MGIQVPGGELQSSPEIFVATFHHEFLKNFWRLADTEHYTEHGVVWLQATILNRLNFSSLFILCSSTTPQFHRSLLWPVQRCDNPTLPVGQQPWQVCRALRKQPPLVSVPFCLAGNKPQPQHNSLNIGKHTSALIT